MLSFGTLPSNMRVRLCVSGMWGSVVRDVVGESRAHSSVFLQPELATMKVVLELQDQPSNIKRVTVRHDIVIGRGADCNLRLSSPQVSRRHCFLRINADGVTITDLDSSNGTFIDGEKVSSGARHAIRNGATVTVGPVRFVAQLVADPVVSEILHVDVVDDKLDAEAVSDEPVSHLGTGVSKGDSSENEMSFSIEQGGLAAGDDDPTADYNSSEQFGLLTPETDRAEDVGSESEFIDSGGRAAADSLGFAPSTTQEAEPADVETADDGPLIEVVPDTDDDDQIEVIDEDVLDVETVLDADVEVIEVDEVDVIEDEEEVLELVEIIEEGEDLESAVDLQDDVTELIADGSSNWFSDDSASDDDQLNTFLDGLK